MVFALIAKHAAAGDWEKLASAYRKGMRLILVINVPAAVGLTVLAVPIIRLLFQRGAFTAEDTTMMQPVLAVYALGLPVFSFVNMALRAFYARKDTATPVRAALLSFAVNLVLSIALMKPLGTVGLAGGQRGDLAQAWYLQRRLADGHDGLRFGHLAVDLAKVVVASLVMGVVVGVGWWFWPQPVITKFNDALGLVVLIGGGVAVYGWLLWLLRIEGRDDLAAVLAKVRAKLFMKLKFDWFLTGMVLATVLAWLFPKPGAAGGWLHPELLTKGGIALIFFLHGAALSFASLKAGALNWRLHLLVQGSTYLFFPLLGFGAIWLLADHVPAGLSLGFFYLCALPSTVSSSVALTAAARGNVAGAVFNATLSSLLGVVLTPLWIGAVLRTTGQTVALGPVILDLCCWLVLPLALGQLARPWIAEWIKKHKARINVADRATILVLV